jgi:hypothetical protein
MPSGKTENFKFFLIGVLVKVQFGLENSHWQFVFWFRDNEVVKLIWSHTFSLFRIQNHSTAFIKVFLSKFSCYFLSSLGRGISSQIRTSKVLGILSPT